MDSISTAVSLAERIKAGDPAAEEELVTVYRRGVLVLARARTRDLEAAKDLTQDVLTEAIKELRAGKLRESEKLAAYIAGIAHNLINNLLKKQFKRSECPLEETELATSDPVKEHESADHRRRVRREIGTLRIVDQQILLWSFVDGLPLAEIAARLGMSHNSVRTRKSRAVRKLKKKFGRV